MFFIHGPPLFSILGDELGVLAIVDMMYGTDGSGKAPDQPDPQATLEQAEEFRDNVRRMAHHPSLAMYTGCNECMGLGMTILNDFVLKTVATEDDSRPVLRNTKGYSSTYLAVGLANVRAGTR